MTGLFLREQKCEISLFASGGIEFPDKEIPFAVVYGVIVNQSDENIARAHGH